MEDISLAEDLLERVEGMLHQLEDVVSSDLTMTEEILYQAKEELESFLRQE